MTVAPISEMIATLPTRQKTALITGINGQDGSYLAELLLEKGYMVHGIIRKASVLNTERIDHIFEQPMLKLHYGDLTDATSLLTILATIQPDEVYNLAAQSHVKVSFELPAYTCQVDGVGTLHLLECILKLGLDCKLYQASTSELYGKVQEIPQNENTPFYPRSPYGVAKLYAYWITVNYREQGLFACNGILFNHESPRRGRTFVTRKITRAIAEYVVHRDTSKTCLTLGNLDARRDWGHAKDYVEAMWRILQQPTPQDYVVSTGEDHSVREFIEVAFEHVGIEIKWEGEGIDEVGIGNGEILIRISEKYFRPTEVQQLLGDYSKAKRELGWQPTCTFQDLVQEMVDSDIEEVKKGYK